MLFKTHFIKNLWILGLVGSSTLAFGGPRFREVYNLFTVDASVPTVDFLADQDITTQGWIGRYVEPSDMVGEAFMPIFKSEDPLTGAQLGTLNMITKDGTSFENMQDTELRDVYAEGQKVFVERKFTYLTGFSDPLAKELSFSTANGQLLYHVRTAEKNGQKFLMVAEICMAQGTRRCISPFGTVTNYGQLTGIAYYWKHRRL